MREIAMMTVLQSQMSHSAVYAVQRVDFCVIESGFRLPTSKIACPILSSISVSSIKI